MGPERRSTHRHQLRKALCGQHGKRTSSFSEGAAAHKITDKATDPIRVSAHFYFGGLRQFEPKIREGNDHSARLTPWVGVGKCGDTLGSFASRADRPALANKPWALL